MAYTGKEICQGCRKSGADSPREDKNSLCHTCDKLLKLGKCKEVEVKENYTYVRQWYHALQSIDLDGLSLNAALHKVLTSIDNKHAEHSDVRVGFMKQYFDNSFSIKAPSDILDPIKTLFEKLDQFVIKLKKEKKALSEHAKNEAYDHKNEIFKQGVEAGKSLLIQLNSGQLSMSEFDKTLNYPQ